MTKPNSSNSTDNTAQPLKQDRPVKVKGPELTLVMEDASGKSYKVPSDKK
ncbi:hypothetical protein NQ836_18530 [Acinetobacter baumannii]|nr:hypothetical protein [Acinetobacter baumannii]